MSKFSFKAPKGTSCYTPAGTANFRDGTFETDDAKVADFVRKGRLVVETTGEKTEPAKEESPKSMTKAEIVAELEAKGIEPDTSMKKAELQAILDGTDEETEE